MIMPMVKLKLSRIVVDVDTQRHFFNTDSFVCVSDHRAVLANVLRVINWAHHNHIRRISTVQPVSYLCGYCPPGVLPELDDGKVYHTIRGRSMSFDAGNGEELPLCVLERYEQLILCKRCFDPFEEPRLDRTLTELKADEFILLGAATEGAVKATALGLLSRGKKVTIVEDATGSYDQALGRLTLRILEHRGAAILHTKELTMNCSSPQLPVYELQWL